MTPRANEAAPVESAAVESGRRVPPVGELLHLPPSQIATSTNIRRDLALDKDFVASVRQHGVLLPLTATRDLFGDPIVVDGHRRLAAARQAGLETVPVYVRPPALDEGAVRIAEQIVANDQRTALSAGDRLEAIGQLALFGLSDEQISAQTRVPLERVAVARQAVSDERLTALREAAQEESLAGDIQALAVAAEALEAGVPQDLVEENLSRSRDDWVRVRDRLQVETARYRAVAEAIASAAQRGEELLSAQEWMERTGSTEARRTVPGWDVSPAHQAVCVAPCRVAHQLQYGFVVFRADCCLEPDTCPGMQAEAAAAESAAEQLRARREEIAAREAERRAAAVESTRLRTAHLQGWLWGAAAWQCTDLVVRLLVTLQDQAIALSWPDQDLGEVLRDWLGISPAQAATRAYSARASAALVLASLEAMCSEELTDFALHGVRPWSPRPLEQAAAYLVALDTHVGHQMSGLEEELLAALAGEDGADGQATAEVEEAATGEGGEEA